GLTASRRVLEQLDERHLRGELVVLGGNLRALAQDRRYLDRDLNRGWSDEALAALREREGCDASPEDLEQLELVAAIEAAIADARGPVHVADLHATSADGVPFVLSTDAPEDLELARAVPMLHLRGILDAIHGTLAEWLSRRGVASVAIEGGQNASPRAA